MTNLTINPQIIAQGGAQTRYKEYTYTIAAGAAVTIDEIFNYFRVLSQSASTLNVQFGDDPNTSAFSGAGIGIKFENLPSRVTIRNTGGVSTTITFALAIGYIYDDRLNVSGTVTISGSVSTTTATVLNSVADVTVAAGVQTAVIAANAARRGVIITNIGANVTRIGDATNTSATRGAQLLANQSITIETLDAIDAFSTSGTSLSVLEY
jgi:hypothetical protein